MGISVVGALITLTLSLLSQSPQALKRIGLGSSEFDQRSRSFTTYAFAFIILGLGFFLAGVPIGEQTAEQPTDTQPTTIPAEVEEQAAAETASPEPQPTPPLTPETGAFGGPPPDLASPETITSSTNITTTPPLTGTIVSEPTLLVNEVSAEPTNTVAATATPEPTFTPTPTQTPLPTLTPTPISGQTAVIDIGGGNVWMLRSPGGQNLLILSNGDTVIILDGRANQGGDLWQEIMTVNGVVGWIQADFLLFNES